MEINTRDPQVLEELVNKAFAVLESIADLESALWDVFYNDFLDRCAEKSEKLDCDTEETNVIF
jgi:hypothetical protein